MPRGWFVTVEGIEGVGKSSRIRELAENFRVRGQSVEHTREPGGTPLGDAIRQLILNPPGGEAPSHDTELLLLFSARAEHVARRIRPLLEAGTTVLCDRFTDATYAYQGGGRGVPAERIEVLEQWVHADLRPDRTLLLDASVEVALARARGRGVLDRFEREAFAFFERARETYLERARAEPDRFRVIDAERDPVEVLAALEDACADLFPGDD